MFRMAAIFHGIKGRLARGTAASERAKEYARDIEWMAELGWRQVHHAVPEFSPDAPSKMQ
jgi:hypothetical protein